MLGERIRKLRKQKKMTLETLAGEELTKGMLSLIENNKANPSMESLTYIAMQLGVDVTDLLEEISSKELREVLEKAETLYNTDSDKLTNKYEQLLSLIEPYLEKLSGGYESARLLDIYSRSLYFDKKNGWHQFLDRAAIMYDQMNLTAKRAAIGIFRALDKFTVHDYTQALDIFLRERAEIEANHAYLDAMTRVDLDYYESILYFAVGDSDSATDVMEGAINFSKENRIFYHIDDLYRLAAAHAMMSHNEERKAYYLKKLKQYGEFADDIEPILFHDLLNLMSLISEKHDYVGALEIIDQHLQDLKVKDLKPLLLLEKGKAFYGLCRFEEAIQCFDKITIPSYIHHPFDLSLFYVMESYKALCYLGLGSINEAFKSAQVAMENFDQLPETPFKKFSIKTYEMVRGKINL